jgi:hypothetical protein
MLGAAAVLAGAAILFSSDDVGGSPDAAAAPRSSPAVDARRSCPDARRGLRFYRTRRAEWLARMGGPRPTVRLERPRTCARARALAELARDRARRARRQYERRFELLYERFECVHRNEGAWDDAGAPYYGGLQMGAPFERAYGPEFLRRWGHADRWPVWAQLLAAERGRRAGGWRHWPNTARECGLL